MKKKVIVICAVLCVLGLGAGVIYAMANSKADNMFLAGQLFQSKREAQDPNRGEQVAATYHEHVITVETVEYQKEMNLLRSAEAAASYQTDPGRHRPHCGKHHPHGGGGAAGPFRHRGRNR